MTHEPETKYYCLRQTPGVDEYLGGFGPLPGEPTPVAGALGRVLCADATASHAWPPATRSTRDGYALRSADADTARPDAPAPLRVSGECRVDQRCAPALGAGEACRVYTGSELPPGADAVLMQEHAREQGGVILLGAPVPVGANTLPAGADFTQGALLARAGRRLRPQDLALLAQCFRSVEVRRPALLGILSTGDEFCVQGGGEGADAHSSHTAIPLGSHASGALLLDALARSLGASSRFFGVSPDDPAAMRARVEAILEGTERCDVLVITGGSSGGRRDVSAQALASIPGCTLTGADQKVSSGRPMVFGRIGSTSLWVLPGHLLSLFMSAQLFIAPLLRRLMGLEAENADAALACARLERHLPCKGVFPAHYPVTLERDATGLRAWPVLLGTGRNAVLRDMAGWVTVPGDSQGLPAGHAATVRLFA